MKLFIITLVFQFSIVIFSGNELQQHDQLLEDDDEGENKLSHEEMFRYLNSENSDSHGQPPNLYQTQQV